MYDIDYEIYKYINELADQYVELDELLKQNHLTFNEAIQKNKAVQRSILCFAFKVFYRQSKSCRHLL